MIDELLVKYVNYLIRLFVVIRLFVWIFIIINDKNYVVI